MGELSGVYVGERQRSARRLRLDDVIRNIDVTEAELFGGLHEIADDVEIGTDFSLWKMNADFHGHAACGSSVAPDSNEMGSGAGVQSRQVARMLQADIPRIGIFWGATVRSGLMKGLEHGRWAQRCHRSRNAPS